MEVVTAGAYVMISHHGCGANVKGPEFVTLCIILCIATVSEWYEFTGACKGSGSRATLLVNGQTMTDEAT